MTYNFLNTHIKPIKKYDGEIKGKKIVISTCFFSIVIIIYIIKIIHISMN